MISFSNAEWIFHWQVTFGTDCPFVAGLEAVEGLSGYEADQRAIARNNAVKLLPAVKAG